MAQGNQEAVKATVSVVIVTWRRPEYVRRCLAALTEQPTRAHQILVVDASEDTATAEVVAQHPVAALLPFPQGAGHMTTARNHGLVHATGAVVAFLDDDANARPDWMEHVVIAHAQPGVGAVAGRTCNDDDGEADEGAGQVGLLLPTGRLTGNFAADTRQIVDVDHGIGANMSFKRELLAALGGFRDDFPGTAMREDSDIFLRVRALGHRVVYAPSAVADHVAAPHVRGQRFDFRYVFWARHNHFLLLARNFGWGSPMLRRWLVLELRDLVGNAEISLPKRILRAAAGVLALTAGALTSLRKARWGPTPPARVDTEGRRIRRQMELPIS